MQAQFKTSSILFLFSRQMNKISDRRIKNAHPLLANQDDQGALTRMSTNVQLLNNSPPTMDQMKKKIIHLQKTYISQKESRIQAEENLKLYQIRSIAREKQFHKILEESDKKVRSYVKDSEASATAKQIKKYYEQIFENFQKTNQATACLLQSKYKESLASMERRIEEILRQFDEQLGKSKVMSNQNINEIRREIQQALHLVRGIENENEELRYKIVTQKNKNKLIEQERKLLIEEVVYKKMVIVKVLQQNKILKKKISQMSKQQPYSKQARWSKDNYEQIKNENNVLIRFKNILSSNLKMMQTKETTLDQGRDFKFENQSFNTTPIKTKINQKNRKYEKSRLNSSSQLEAGSKEKKMQSSIKNIMYMNDTQKLNGRRQNRKFSQNSVHQKRKLLLSQNDGYMMTMAKNSTIKTESGIEDQKSDQKTIAHLRRCLERQKKKTSQLGKLVKCIRNKNQEVNQALIQMLQTAKLKSHDESDQLTNFLKCQELLKLISDMKKRLAMCQNPTLNCGWGDLEIENLIKEVNEH